MRNLELDMHGQPLDPRVNFKYRIDHWADFLH